MLALRDDDFRGQMNLVPDKNTGNGVLVEENLIAVFGRGAYSLQDPILCVIKG